MCVLEPELEWGRVSHAGAGVELGKKINWLCKPAKHNSKSPIPYVWTAPLYMNPPEETLDSPWA